MERILKHKLPKEVDKKTKDLIIRVYFDAINDIGPDEHDYIQHKIQNKINITKIASTAWVSELSKYFEILYEVYHRHQKGDLILSQKAFNLITAALLYFINPFDIIPDYTPGIGYIDDLIVLIQCIRSLDKNDKLILQEYFLKI